MVGLLFIVIMFSFYDVGLAGDDDFGVGFFVLLVMLVSW